MRASLTLDEFPGRAFRGTLARTANAIGLTSRTLLIEVDVDNPRGELLPGAYVFVHLELPRQVRSGSRPRNSAFQQVEDNLAVLRILEQEGQQQRLAVDSAQESLRLFTNRYRGGVDNCLQVITAQTATLTNQRAEIDILRRRLDASVLLVKALGGGWHAAELSKAAQQGCRPISGRRPPPSFPRPHGPP